ncbi:MAG: hypothetical protein NVSMB9_00820 [Isosphaeraceae bacterium]
MKDWLLHALADRLGVEHTRAGEALVPTIRFENSWPQWMTLLVILGSVAFVVWLYFREGGASLPYRLGLATLRSCLVLLAIFMLFEAVLSIERTGLPDFVMLIDDSASQQVVDQYENPKTKASVEKLARATGRPEASRWAVGQGLLLADDARLLREIQKQNKIRLYLTSASSRLIAQIEKPEDLSHALEKLKRAEPSGGQSRLGASVRQVLTELRGAPPSAILLLSDGQNTEGESLTRAAELASRKGVPLYTVGLGSPERPRDLELTELLVDEAVFVDDLVRFQAKLLARGLQDQLLTVRLLEQPSGAPVGSTPVVVESVQINGPADNQAARVEVLHRPRQTGEFVFTLEVEAQPREVRVDNNRIVRTVNVRKDKIRVLLVDSEPRYEYRYLKNYLEREETIQLHVVLLSSDPEYSDQDRSALPSFPAAKQELFAYDVILLGDADPGLLSQSQMQNLAEFVTDKGGGVLFIAGESFNPLEYRNSPLEVLIPIELNDARNPSGAGQSVGSFRPELTAEGRSSPIFRFGDDEAQSVQIWQNLPELFWFLEAPRKKPGALVLAEHPKQVGSDGKVPLFLYQFVGAGKSMFNAVDDTWRWRFREGDRFFGRFWMQTIRFLARSKLIRQKPAELHTDRRRYHRNQPVQIRVRFPNPGLAPTTGEVSAQVEKKGQAPRKITLKVSPTARNIFEGVLPQSSEGEYEVRLLPSPLLEGQIVSTVFQVEPPASEFEHTEMNQAELLRAADLSHGKFYLPENVESLLDDVPKSQRVPLEIDPPIPLWNTWVVLVFFLMLVTAEWTLRKRKRMV